MSWSLPRLAVVLDFGAASPMSVLAAARGLAEIVFLCDRDLPYVRSRFDDIAALAAVEDVTGLADAAVGDRLAALRPAGVTTFSERQIVRTAALAHPLGLAYHSPVTALALTDKFAQRQALAAAGVQHTRCRVVRAGDDIPAAAAEVGLPAVLKPRSGAASAYSCRVDTAGEAAARMREFAAHRPASPPAEFVLEEVLAGDSTAAGPDWADYVSVESVTSGGVVHHVEVTGKFPLAPPFRETGYVIPATLDDATRRAVLALTTAALAALGVRDGASHVEVKLGPAGPRIIELNGRVGGYVADILRRANGVDLVRAALMAALGRAPDLPLVAGRYHRHAFQYFLTPPMTGGILRRLDGVERLTDQRGIQAVEIFKQVGDHVDWRDGTLAYVGIVHGSAPDHRAVLDLVGLIHRTLRIEYGAPAAGPEHPPSNTQGGSVTT